MAKIKAKHLFILGLLILISIVIWLKGPELVIANQHPLQQSDKRFYIIVILFLAWLLSLFTKPDQTLSTTAVPKTQEAKAKLQALRDRFNGAIQFLKKNQITKQDKNINLSQLPWYLLIGPSGTGKTTLLANANVNYILTKQIKQEKLATSDTCDWWVTRDLVLVDMPGSYLKEKNNFLWDSFLNFIKKHRNISALRGIAIALPFPELIKQQNSQHKKQIVIEIKQKISQLHQQFGNQLFIYFVVTKCDQLPGFLEFFSESGIEELSQAWGITLPTRKIDETLLDLFTQRFNMLIKRINNQLITRLHQERNPNARPAIKDFPLQMERLKETMSHFLKALSMPDLHLQGVYLTSALQVSTEDQAAQSQIINPQAHQALQLLRMPALPTKAYFIRQFILQGLLSGGEQSTARQASPKSPLPRRATYATSLIAIIAAAILLGRDFQQSVLRTYAIQNNLAQYQLAIQQPNQQSDPLLKALPLLNSLQTAAHKTNGHLSQFENLLSFYSDKSHQTASKVYQQALQTIAFPAIKNYLENYLQNPSDRNPVQLYAALKAYLMLGDLKNFEAKYVADTLTQLIPALNKQANSHLISHIQAASSQTSNQLKLNNDVIVKVRTLLTRLPNHELALVILKNKNNDNSTGEVNLNTQFNNQAVFVNNLSSGSISALFTAKKFSAVFSQEIAVAANETLRGNWVIGNPEVMPNEATINELVQSIQSRYITNYVGAWEGLLNNLKLVTPTSLAQTDVMITNLTSSSSPLLQLLQTIKQNTSYEPIVESSPKILVLNNLLANAQSDRENTLYQIFVALRQLHFYLHTILSSTDSGNAAFEAAKARMLSSTGDSISEVHHLADEAPEPLKSWLNTLANASWHFVMQEASQHIENAWQVNISTLYQSQFANRFPLNASANEEVDLQQFASFVGKQGTFASFYQRYLKPFVNDTNKKWEWRVADKETLPFSSEVLEQLQQVDKLQGMSKYALFSQGQNNPALQRFQLPDKLIDKEDEQYLD